MTTKTKTKTKRAKASVSTSNGLSTVAENLPATPAVLPTCMPTVSNDQLVDYAVNEYENKCQSKLSEIRPLLLNAQRDVSACAKAAQNFVDIAVQRAGDEFREQASRAFDSLGLKLAKEHTKVKELARSGRAVKLSYELGRGTYDMFAKQDTLILAEEINELDAAHRDAMAVEQKIAQRLRFWQGKLDAAGQVRRDMRSKLTRATLSTVKGGIELLQNMMSGFEEAYLREPTND